MKRISFLAIAFFSFIMLMMIVSCTSLDFMSGEKIDVPPENLPPVLEYDDKLNDPVFAKLPPEVKNYLQVLSNAFVNHDRDFLLLQGEAMFEKMVRPFYDDNEYFIMLYRMESNADDVWDDPFFGISHIEFTGWEAGDPVMEIRGRIFYNDENVAPCQLMLAWKLDEPKIIGWYP